MIPGATARTLRVGALQFSAWEMGLGPTVVCLHGFPDTAHSWRLMLPAVAEAGFRAVAVSTRGYEPGSIPPDGDFSIAALAQDVGGWLDALEVQQAHLIGHDWGAAIACAAAVAHAPRIVSLTALAAPHPVGLATAMAGDLGQMLKSWYISYFQIRGRPERIVPRRDFAFLERLWRAWSPGWAIPSEDLEAMKSAFRKPGVLEATLACYRQALDRAHPRLAENAALLGAPVLARTLGLAGVNDGCIKAEVFAQAMPTELFPGGLAMRSINDAGHFLHLEQPEAVHQHIIAHLRACPSA